jgi:hydroxypyruvate reductase
VPELLELRDAALEIFRAALRSADAGEAVRRVVRLDGARLNIGQTTINLGTRRRRPVYSIAIGKAAHAMAAALDDVLGERLEAGLLAGLPSKQSRSQSAPAQRASSSLANRWRVFAGGHPLPNEESLAAARAAFDLLRRADVEKALLIFLISGGGSALLELPRDEKITLKELREANHTLIQSGASIAEINAVRRAISAVKGGGLSAHAPRADQISLIISDTNAGEESNVASGPAFEPPPDAPDATTVIARYELAQRLPASILRVIDNPAAVQHESPGHSLQKHYVLLTNEDAIAAAAGAARSQGFVVEFARNIVEQEIGAGCKQLLERLTALRQRAGSAGRVVCLLSGGEFACRVRGRGLGGRNSETALRLALQIEEHRESNPGLSSHVVALSAGTDGIDGNSPAAGAISDETTLKRAQALGLNARESLETSDAYTFFEALGDAIVTGPTDTNVRDVRVMLAI